MSSRLQGLDMTAIQHVVATAQALEAGRSEEAAAQLSAVLISNPTHPEVLRLHAGTLSLRGDHTGAFRAMQDAVGMRPQDALYHNTMATVLANAGELDIAVEALRHACTLQPDLAVAWYNLGVMLIRCVRYDDAADALQRVVVLASTHLEARAQLADMLRMSGHAAKAEAEYRRVLAEEPLTGMAWWGLANIKTLRFTTRDIEQMRMAMRDSSAREDDLVAIGFALAKGLDDYGFFAESFNALTQANAIARRRKTWDAPAFSSSVDEIHAAFIPLPAGAPATLGHEVIFVVGLPRSGSTLVEQILASHSQVEGAGELPDVAFVLNEESKLRKKPFPQWVGEMHAEDWTRLGSHYLQRTAHWRKRRPIFVDKLPGNWMYIGFIRAILPAARIICCRRDPLETCFSCYRQGNGFTRTFDDLAAYWREYDRSIQKWHALHPSHVHEHCYEDLIANPEATIRKLLEFCGLTFEPVCLRFYENKRAVRSPSAMQVRQPLRKDTARAQRYGALLDPLRAALGFPPFSE